MIQLLRHPLARVLVCALAGTLMFLSCADFDIWPLAWLAMVPMLFVVLDEDCRSPFFYGWVTGLLANGGGFYWINGLLQRFGHMPFIASAPIYLLLIAYQALAIGFFAWALRHLRDRTQLPVTLLAPVLMTAIELVVPFVFPWYYAITQAWVRPVIQIADLTGPLGVTFLLMLSNGALYQTFRAVLRRQKPSWKPPAAALGVIAIALAYGQVRIHQVEAQRAAAPKVTVGVVQANVGINEKGVRGLELQQLALHQKLSADLERRGAELIVWPESSYPFALARTIQSDFPSTDRRQVMHGFHTPLVFGALTIGDDSPYPFNTALLLQPEPGVDDAPPPPATVRGFFDKNFLLVFGEYIPFYERLSWIKTYIPEAGNFARGTTVTTFPLHLAPVGDRPARDLHVGPMICYEDIIPAFGRRLVANQPKPNLLVNITNDAWFGATSEPYEHMALAVYRAVEHRLDLVRAVNTGVSALIDATGRVEQQSPAVDPAITPDVQPETLLGDMAVLDASGLYGSLGDLFGALNLIAALALGAWARKRAGMPLAWRLVGEGVVVMLLATLAVLVVLVGPGSTVLGVKLLLHRPLDATQETFDVGMRAVVALLAAALSGGFFVGKRMREPRSPRVEVVVAAVAAFLAPPLLFGRIEGETASLVFTALGASALGLLGVRLARGKGK